MKIERKKERKKEELRYNLRAIAVTRIKRNIY